MLPQDAILGSTKIQQLEKMLPDLKSRGSRVLLFSQWTSVLDLLEWYLALRGHAYCRLDGSTNVRARHTSHKPRGLRPDAPRVSIRRDGPCVVTQT